MGKARIKLSYYYYYYYYYYYVALTGRAFKWRCDHSVILKSFASLKQTLAHVRKADQWFLLNVDQTLQICAVNLVSHCKPWVLVFYFLLSVLWIIICWERSSTDRSFLAVGLRKLLDATSPIDLDKFLFTFSVLWIIMCWERSSTDRVSQLWD